MRVEHGRLVDDAGRTLIVRGCCLGGDSKLPSIDNGDPASVSFVGRPFPVEEADEHFGRLKSWGFTFLRVVLTWEAVEHAGPGIYDESYLAYLRKVLKKAEEFGIAVYMDPHQDAWSRWTGGDGAPSWTLERVGFDLSRLAAAGAVGDPAAALPMSWPINYNRYAAATMFTLFFAGETYAPGFLIEGESSQEWLQSRYIAAMRHAYRRLKDCRAIVGWGAMNEPHPGFIGLKNLASLESCPYAIGPVPTPFQAMAAASGHPSRVPLYKTGIFGRRAAGERTMNPSGVSLFLDGFACPWKGAGIWSDDGGTPRLLKADHFASFEGRPVSFADDFLKPFIKRFASVIREVRPEALVFIEGVPHSAEPTWDDADGSGFVDAVHWYDGATLVSKKYRRFATVDSDTHRLVVGRGAVRRSFRAQLARRTAHAANRMGGMPVLLGEFGLPFDLNGGGAFRNGDYSIHEEALSAYFDAVDANMLSATIWNYSASNTNAGGDGWNGEDLSIWSSAGGPRAISGWRRPYPMAVAGKPLAFAWDRAARRFELRYEADPTLTAPTEIYAPEECFGGEIAVRIEAGDESEISFVREGDRIQVRTGSHEGEVRAVIERR